MSAQISKAQLVYKRMMRIAAADFADVPTEILLTLLEAIDSHETSTEALAWYAAQGDEVASVIVMASTATIATVLEERRQQAAQRRSEP